MLGVIIITITNKDGTKSRIEVPDDSKVEITKSEISDPKGWHGWPADAPPPAIAPFNAEQAKQHQKAWAKYLNIDVEYTNSIGMKFRLIPPGEFMMGSTAAEIEEALIKYADKDKMYQHMIKSQAPQHKVILTQPIYLGVNEVTQAEYEKVMGVNPSYFSPMGGGKDAVAGMDTGSHPVEMVSWNDAAEFCAKLSKQEELKPFYLRADETVIPLNGTGYRLPTEAEWEYACRAGTTTKYWIGDKEEDLLRAGWLATNAGVRTYAAGELKANPYGLCDIHGNVSEFVQDMWDLDYYSEFAKTPASDPVNPHSDTFPRVIRGGHAAHDAVGCRAAYREAYPFASPAGHIGFRVALTVTGRPKPAGPAMPKSVATTPSTPAVAGPIDFAAERKAAEWVLSVGGSVQTIDEAGVIVGVEPGGKLPDGQWQLNTVWLTNCKNIKSGALDKLASCRSLITLNARATNMGDADCQAIGRITNLESLDLTGSSQITNTGIKNLAPLRKLRELGLTFIPISDDAMDVIAGMTELRTLGLGETQVTDVGFKKLAPLVLLENLGPSPGVTDQGLSILGNFPQLKLLGLKGHQITDISVAQLQKLPKLTTFSLVAGTDENLPKMKGLTQLRWLGLNLCQFTEQGFQTLLDFKWLQTVNIGGDPKFDDTRLMSLSEITDLKLVLFDKSSSVSPKGIENFRAARPDVRVNDGVQDYPATSSIPFSVLQQLDETDPLPKWELPAGSPLPVVAPCSPEDAAALQQKWAEHLKRPVVEADKLDMKFALIPPGEFRKIFTRPRDPAIEPDMPVRRFRITKPYALSTTEVTWDQFRQFVEATGYQTEAETNGLGGREFNPDPKINWRTPGWKPAPNEPVTQVTPRDAEAFCAWLTDPSSNPKSKIENRKFLYRLPTEAEWVHACRAGSVHKHVVGPEPGDLADYAWTQEFLDPDPQASPLHLVAQKKPNPFGLHDTLGNVWEYTRDSLSPSLVPYLPTNDPVSYGAGNSLGSNYGETQPAVHTDWGWVGWNTPQNNQGFRVLKQFDGEPLPGPLDRPLLLRAGQPLSGLALVPRPEKIPGLQSWSVELAGPNNYFTSSLVVNPKSDLIATGPHLFGKISLWDHEGNYQRALLGHEAQGTSLDFSSDGRWLASCEAPHDSRWQNYCTARVWNAETGAVHLVTPVPHLGMGFRLKFAPNGEHLAFSVWNPCSFVILNLATGRIRNSPDTAGSCGLAWSPEGTEIACAHKDNRLRVWDAKTFKVLREVELPMPLPWRMSLEWSPDGRLLALVTNDRKGSVRDAKTLEIQSTFGSSVTDSAHALAWFPDSRRLLVAQNQAPAAVFDTVSGQSLISLAGSEGHASLALCKNNQEAVGEAGGRLFFYDTVTGQKVREGQIRGVPAGWSSTLTRNGREVFTIADGKVFVSDAATGTRKRSFSILNNQFLEPSPDGTLLALRDFSGHPIVQFIDSQTGKIQYELPHAQGKVTRVVWSPDGKWLATGATDNLVRVWNLSTGKTEHELYGHTGAIWSLAWSPDGTLLASAAADSTVRLWNPLTGQLISNHDKFPELMQIGVNDWAKLAWTSDSRRVWIALTKQIVPLDVATGTVGPPEQFSTSENLMFLNTSPNGERMLVREGYSWMFVRGQDAQDRRLLGRHLGYTTQWHPDSRRFLGWEPHHGSGSTVGFDVESNRRLGQLFALLPGDHWLCIGPTGHYRGSPGVEDQFVYVAMLPDGSQRTYTPAEFAKTFGWKNDLDKATLLQLNP